MSGWLDYLLEHLGEPIPCAICGEPTPPGELTEATVPGLVIAEWDMTVHRVVWVCPRCPIP